MKAPRTADEVPQTFETPLSAFAYAHLPASLQGIAAPFSEMAHRLVSTLPKNAARATALGRLHESSLAAIRGAQ